MDPQNIHPLSRLDDAGSAEALARFLEVAATRYFAEINAHSYARLRAGLGASVLDVGCGTGSDACALARVVGPAGKVTALDANQAMLNAASRRAAKANLPIEFHHGNAQRLGFVDHSFGAVRCSRLLCYIQDPLLALREMVRVLRPGGHVVCFEPDHETLVIASPDHDCTRKIVNSFCDSFLSGWSGRWLPVWFRQLGLQEILIEPWTLQMDYDFLIRGLQLDRTVHRLQEASIITAQDAVAWFKYQQEAAEAGLFYSAITFFLASGKKTLECSKEQSPQKLK